jgi:hypothetical protein
MENQLPLRIQRRTVLNYLLTATGWIAVLYILVMTLLGYRL